MDATTNISRMCSAALDYAARGWEVFPAPPGEKKSCKAAKYSGGIKWGKTTDPKTVNKDFRKFPDANIGVATGVASGIFVIEADTPEGHDVDGLASIKALEAEHGALPDTLMAISPSGSVHRYFNHPGAQIKVWNSDGKIAPGVDIRGDGGMVIAPPSIKPNVGIYKWLNEGWAIADAPTWLIEAVSKPVGKEKVSKPSCDTGSEKNVYGQYAEAHGSDDLEADPEKIAEALAVIPNNDVSWEEWNRVVMAAYRATNGSAVAFAAIDKWSANASKYNAENTARKWDALRNCPPINIGAGTIFMMAKEARQKAIAVPTWREQRKGGEPVPSMHNARLAITALGIECHFDTFHNKMLFGFKDDRVRHSVEHISGEVTDNGIIRLRQLMSDTFGIDFTDKHSRDAVISLALDHCFDPVVDMLEEAESCWDGVKRLDRMAADYFSCEDTPLNAACLRKVMIAAVARARIPGIKFDAVLVLESDEGFNKSTAWNVLAGDENFSDEKIIGKDSREVQEQLAEIWIHENADLAGMKKAEVETVKAFASRRKDIARPAYGHFTKKQDRHSIEVGTTNADTYLQSQTGNRRFWPMKVLKTIDIEKLKRDRLLLWGEAAHYQSRGESLVLGQDLWDKAGEEQEKRRVVDPWEMILREIPQMTTYSYRKDGSWHEGTRTIIHYDRANKQEKVIAPELLQYVLDISPGDQRVDHGMKLSTVMKRLGWDRNPNGYISVDGNRVRGYFRLRGLSAPRGQKRQLQPF